MVQDIHIDLDGKSYTWTGAEWYETDTFLTPPLTIVRTLNARLTQRLARQDATISDLDVLLERASTARDALQHERAEKLVRRALRLSPGNPGALAILCSVLRARGLPQQALDETEAFRAMSYPPLLTSRAAALCDLGRWEEAKREVGRALAIAEGSEEAFSVARRIKAARPDLY